MKLEKNQAPEALIKWFRLQEISLEDSAIIMAQILAITVAKYAVDKNDLKRGLLLLNKSINNMANISWALDHKHED